MEIVTSIAVKISDGLFGAFERQFGYVVHCNDNVKDFQRQTDKLSDTRVRVQRQIDAAKRNGEVIETDVERWVANVQEANEDAKNFIDEFGANKKFLNGWCIDLRLRYKFSRRAKEKTLATIKLQEEGKFENVSHPAPSPGIISSSTKFSDAFESRRSIMKKVMEALRDENIHMIGICGMGGVGKTTMVTEIAKQVQEEKLIDEVVMATVSQSPNLAKIQEEIADMLGLILNNRESIRKGSLWQRMKQNGILVILDDVWEKIDLKKVGIPFENDHRGCKIILTSRSEDICNQMHTQKNFTVGVLSEQESWSLFRETAGEAVDSFDINPIAKEVAAKCDGLPIAILTVGSTLKNKSKHVWANAARQLKESVSINIQEIFGEVFSTLKVSYDYLKSKEAKSYFLLCCLFPEDSFISVEQLVRYGLGLRLIQNVGTLEDARGRAHASVSTLISSFLLLDSDIEGCVKMHNVVREVAISIATKDKNVFLVKAGIGLREWPNTNAFDNLTIISLMSNNIRELPNKLECPKLQALLVQDNSDLKNIPINFFQETKDLKVLDISHTDFLISLPSSFSFLAELCTLCLDNCFYLSDISIIGKLNKLEILSFHGCGIEEIPKHFSQLTRLRLLDLNDCHELKCVSAGVISSLRNLEELYVKNSFRNWVTTTGEGDDPRRNASLSELNSLTRLTNLDMQFPDAKILPDLMEFQNLISYNISIGNSQSLLRTDKFIVGLGSRSLSLTHDVNFPLLDWVKNLVKRAQSLQLFDCKGLRNFFPDLDHMKFAELKYLELLGCHDMMYVLNTMEGLRHLPFHSLEGLYFKDLISLCEICHGELPAESFGNVRLIDVSICPKMLSIVPPELLTRLRNLEEFSAHSCDSLLYAFEIEGLVIEKEETKFLSMLKKVDMRYLPEMTHIWKGSIQLIGLCNLKIVNLVHCDKLRVLFSPVLVQDLISLEVLRIDSCNNLEEIFGKHEAREEGEETVVLENDYNVVSSCFKNLTSVDISYCKELRILFTLSIAKGLVQLKELTVEGCPKLQEIVSREGQDQASTEIIVFPHLQSVEFKILDSLTSFFPGYHTIEWPALEDLIIDSCSKLKTFGNGLQVTPKLKKVLYGNGDEEHWMGDLNATVCHIFKEKQVR